MRARGRQGGRPARRVGAGAGPRPRSLRPHRPPSALLSPGGWHSQSRPAPLAAASSGLTPPPPRPPPPQVYHWGEKKRIAEYYRQMDAKERADEEAYKAELNAKLDELTA